MQQVQLKAVEQLGLGRGLVVVAVVLRQLLGKMAFAVALLLGLRLVDTVTALHLGLVQLEPSDKNRIAHGTVEQYCDSEYGNDFAHGSKYNSPAPKRL